MQLDAQPAAIVTDGERLRLALVNVLVTAAQATIAAAGDERAATVELSTASLPENRVAIVVCDRGPGIQPEDLSRIFDPYFTTKRTGSGLGLAIARNIVEGLAGTITAVSRVGEGTEIRLELPRQPAGSRLADDASAAPTTAPPVATSSL